MAEGECSKDNSYSLIPMPKEAEENLHLALSNIMRNIEMLKSVMSLYLRRHQIAPEMEELENRVPHVQKLMGDSDLFLKNFQESIKKEAMEMVETMRRQKKAMFYLIREIAKKKQTPMKLQVETPRFPLSEVKSAQINTPRLYVSEYQQSPYIAKIRPTTLYFLDFEAIIATHQFNEIPKYLRGRETCDELNGFLHNCIIPVFMEKYQLVYRKRECIKNPQDLAIWKLYREQMSYFPEQKFITQGDISRKLGRVIDKKMCTRIAMLRHLAILQEQRKSSTVCYIWVASSSENRQ